MNSTLYNCRDTQSICYNVFTRIVIRYYEEEKGKEREREREIARKMSQTIKQGHCV